MIRIPKDYKPTVDEVKKYINKWYSLDNYVNQEHALDKLFGELCPNNSDINDILIKCWCWENSGSFFSHSTHPLPKNHVSGSAQPHNFIVSEPTFQLSLTTHRTHSSISCEAFALGPLLRWTASWCLVSLHAADTGQFGQCTVGSQNLGYYLHRQARS